MNFLIPLFCLGGFFSVILISSTLNFFLNTKFILKEFHFNKIEFFINKITYGSLPSFFTLFAIVACSNAFSILFSTTFNSLVTKNIIIQFFISSLVGLFLAYLLRFIILKSIVEFLYSSTFFLISWRKQSLPIILVYTSVISSLMTLPILIVPPFLNFFSLSKTPFIISFILLLSTYKSINNLFTKIADVMADTKGKIEKELDEDSSENPYTQADNIGDLIGDSFSTIATTQSVLCLFNLFNPVSNVMLQLVISNILGTIVTSSILLLFPKISSKAFGLISFLAVFTSNYLLFFEVLFIPENFLILPIILSGLICINLKKYIQNLEFGSGIALLLVESVALNASVIALLISLIFSFYKMQILFLIQRQTIDLFFSFFDSIGGTLKQIKDTELSNLSKELDKVGNFEKFNSRSICSITIFKFTQLYSEYNNWEIIPIAIIHSLASILVITVIKNLFSEVVLIAHTKDIKNNAIDNDDIIYNIYKNADEKGHQIAMLFSLFFAYAILEINKGLMSIIFFFNAINSNLVGSMLDIGKKYIEDKNISKDIKNRAISLDIYGDPYKDVFSPFFITLEVILLLIRVTKSI